MSCTAKYLSADILGNCEANPKTGLEVDVLLVPKKDVDMSNLTYDANNELLMTNFQLKSGNNAFKLDGVKGKDIHKYFFEKKDTDYTTGYQHKFTGLVLNLTAANRNELYKLENGEEYVAIIEKKWKGADEKDAFYVLGIGVGLVGTVHTGSSVDNGGAEVFELQTKETDVESKPPVTLLHTDYATTKTAFDNKFAQS